MINRLQQHQMACRGGHEVISIRCGGTETYLKHVGPEGRVGNHCSSASQIFDYSIDMTYFLTSESKTVILHRFITHRINFYFL